MKYFVFSRSRFDPAAVATDVSVAYQLSVREACPEAVRVPIVGLSPRAERLWTELPSDPQTVALMIGEERQGLTPSQQATCDFTVRLPMTTGRILYEFVR